VSRVEEDCFGDCAALSTVVFEAGSRISYIARKAFSRDTSMSSILVPSSVDLAGLASGLGKKSELLKVVDTL
jgi:hypothetical protein